MVQFHLWSTISIFDHRQLLLSCVFQIKLHLWDWHQSNICELKKTFQIKSHQPNPTKKQEMQMLQYLFMDLHDTCINKEIRHQLGEREHQNGKVHFRFRNRIHYLLWSLQTAMFQDDYTGVFFTLIYPVLVLATDNSLFSNFDNLTVTNANGKTNSITRGVNFYFAITKSGITNQIFVTKYVRLKTEQLASCHPKWISWLYFQCMARMSNTFVPLNDREKPSSISLTCEHHFSQVHIPLK